MPANVYYDAVNWIIALILLGNLLESRARGQTSAAIRHLLALRPKLAHGVVMGANGEETVADRPVEDLAPGDLVRVLPGERLPAAGHGDLGARDQLAAQRAARGTGQLQVPVARQVVAIGVEGKEGALRR